MSESSATRESATAPGTGKKVLQLHRRKKQWRGRSGVSFDDTIIEFLFSLTPVDGGQTKGPSEMFWCEVQLKKSLAERPGWKKLSRLDIEKALYCYAVEAIRKGGGRVIRHMAVDWIAGTPYAEAPHWDLLAVDLKKPAQVVIEESDGILPVVVHQH